MTSPVDLGVGLVLLVGAGFGAWKGLARQVVGVLAVAAAIVTPYMLAGALAHETREALEAPFPVVFVLWCVVLALGAYVVVRLVCFLPVRWIEKGRDGTPNVLGFANRLAGGLVGAAKFGAWFWVAFSLLAVVAPRIATPAQAARFETSLAYRTAKEHNVFGPGLKDELAALEKVLAELAAGKKKVGPAVAAIASDERVRALVKDDGLRKALREGDVTALGRSAEVLGLVFDREAMRKIEAAVAELAKGGDANGAGAKGDLVSGH